MKEKSAVGADLYIEDSPSNIAFLHEANCDVICFGNSTDTQVAAPRVTKWADVEAIVLERY